MSEHIIKNNDMTDFTTLKKPSEVMNGEESSDEISDEGFREEEEFDEVMRR